jgi:hypothetical protein
MMAERRLRHEASMSPKRFEESRSVNGTGNETRQEIGGAAMPDAVGLPPGIRPQADPSPVAGVPAAADAPWPSLIERIERALVLLAYFIELDGDIHVALYERVETELHALRQRESTKERARRLLADYSRSGGSNAICSKNLSLSSSDGPRPYLGL